MVLGIVYCVGITQYPLLNTQYKMKYRKLKKHTVTLRGPRVTLRPLSEKDWDLLIKWNNDPGVLYYSEGDDRRSWEFKELQEMYRATSRFTLLFVIEIKAEGKQRRAFPRGMKPIGDAWLEKMNLKYWLKKYAKKDMRRVPIFIGEKSEWGKGYGTEVIRLLTDYAFKDGAEMVFGCSISDYNSRCLRAFEKCGYRIVRKVKGERRAKAKWEYDLAVTV